MGWFSRKQPKSLDDALVERTLAFVQEVAEEKPDDEQALLAMIDGIKMMPPKPTSTIDAIDAPARIEAQASLPPSSEVVARERILPATLPPIALPSISLPPVVFAKVADEPIPAPASAKETADADSAARSAVSVTAAAKAAVVTTNLPVTIETTPAEPLARPVVSPPVVSSALSEPVLPQPVLRPAAAERVRPSEPRRLSSAPPQSEMRREIAQRVQNFKAHQQRLNDEREARIKEIYADMQARLEKSGAQKSPPVS